MAGRVSIEVPGFSHVNPIPAACRIGPFLFTGVLTGRDPDTRQMPAGLQEQCRNVFRHVAAVLAAAGMSADDVARMTFWLADPGDREPLNREWLAMFPDEGSRPARHVLPAALEGGALVHGDLVAVASAAQG